MNIDLTDSIKTGFQPIRNRFEAIINIYSDDKFYRILSGRFENNRQKRVTDLHAIEIQLIKAFCLFRIAIELNKNCVELEEDVIHHQIEDLR